MQHIEDALVWIAARLAAGAGAAGLSLDRAWDAGFVRSIAEHARAGVALSEGQAEAACRLVARNARALVESGAVSQAALDGMLDPPRFRHGQAGAAPDRREVRLLGPDMLAFRFGRCEAVRHDIRLLGRIAEAATPASDTVAGVWLVPLLARLVPAIRAVMSRHRFAADAAVRRRLKVLAAHAGKPAGAALAPDGTIRLDARDNEMLACWCVQVAGAWRP